MDKILPIGAVILLKGGSEPSMIVGYLPKGADNKEKDYMGVLYPTGLESMESVRCFNADDIDKVLFEGFVQNNIYKNFIKKVKELKAKN